MKKRIFAILLALALTLPLFAAVPALADDPDNEEYNLLVGGDPVTKGNAADVLGDGSISYDPVAKKLTVNGNYNPGKNVICNRVDGLTVYVAGNSTLDSGKYAGIVAERDMTITGPGKLKVKSADAGIYVRSGAILTIENANVDVESAFGIAGDSTGEKLIIRNSQVHSKGSICAYAYFQTFTLDGCEILSPVGHVIYNGTVTTADTELVDKEVTIGRRYDLYFAGAQVTDLNRSNLFGGGAVSYDRSRKILYIGADVAAGPSAVIQNGIPGLRIYVKGGYSLSSDQMAIVTDADTTITGDGKLTLRGGSAGIFVRGGTLTVDCNLDVSGGDGITGISGVFGEKLVVRNSEVNVSASGDGAIFNFKDITLDGCFLNDPADGKIENGYVRNKDGTIAKTVSIGIRKYDLYVYGTRVTSANASDVRGDGVFSYDDSQRMLTVNGSFKYGGPAIDSSIPNLRITVAGDSYFRALSDPVIVADENLIILGPGKLTLESRDCPAISVRSGSTLEIYNADVEIRGDYGIVGDTSAERLEISISRLKAYGKKGAVTGFGGGIQLDKSYIIYPEDSSVSEGSVVGRDGQLVRDLTVEEKSATRDLDFILHVEDVFDISGRTTVTGLVSRGTVKLGDSVEIRTTDPVTRKPRTITATVLGIAMFGKSFDRAEGGDKPSLWLSDVSTGDIRMGDSVVSAGSPYVDTVAHEKDEPNGRIFGILERYDNTSGSFKDYDYVYAHWNVDCEALIMTDSGDSVLPGGSADAWLQNFSRNATFYVGQELVIRDSSRTTLGKFTVTEIGETEYPLYVNGEQVTGANRNDILGDGKFSYTPNTRKLTVKGGYSFDTCGIRSEIKGLEVYVAADSALTSEADPIIMTTAGITITGPGKLTMTSGTNSCLFASGGARVQIKNAAIKASGAWGLTGDHGGEVLAVINSDVSAAGPNGAICDFFGGVSLDKCSIIKPSGGGFSGGRIVDGSLEIAYDVTIKRDGPAIDNPFVDVKEGDYFYDPVLWAVGSGVTLGTDETHFSPNATCTRAQVVTFLWRAMGSPEPKGSTNPFKDVKSDDYYYKAVLWAVENEITAGTDPDRFSPNAGCTRAQVVTFLWRTEGEPSVSGGNPFVDVKSGEYYYDAVIWAVGKGITKGTDDTHFSPDATCTRGQIVTFLYRDLA